MKIKNLVLTVALLSTVSLQCNKPETKINFGGIEVTKQNFEQTLKNQYLSLLYAFRKTFVSQNVGTDKPCITRVKLFGITWEENTGKTIKEEDTEIVKNAYSDVHEGANPYAVIPFSNGKTFCDFAREMALRNKKFSPYKDFYLEHCPLDKFYKQFKKSCK